ncbi:MAG TPA: twin-arginine translocation signal domain-containing protein, partial [Bacteroidota bacterium]|nr:twin-arginine translocation signal domain-containing protein [Bacteroidota bacterium]
MKKLSRRQFLRTGAIGAASLAARPLLGARAPGFLRSGGDILFKAYPHASMPEMTWAYAADE